MKLACYRVKWDVPTVKRKTPSGLYARKSDFGLVIVYPDGSVDWSVFPSTIVWVKYTPTDSIEDILIRLGDL